MKLNKNTTVLDWRQIFDDSLQVAFTDIPTGEVREVTDEKGRAKKEYVMEERIAFGFQTEQGRGKGVQWIPIEDVDAALDRLEYYAENGVDSVTANDEWLSPADSIDETITRVKREDGGYDISFRVRLGKGSKSCKVPESDFPEFVQSLRATQAQIPAAVEDVIAAQAGKDAAPTTDDNEDTDDE